MKMNDLALTLCAAAMLAACGTDALHQVGPAAEIYADASGTLCAPDETTLLRAAAPRPDLTGCLKLEGNAVGVDSSGSVGGVSFAIYEWLEKEDSRHEFVGFSISAEAAVTYYVKAGQDVFVDTASRWVHPAGTQGRRAHAISYVALCPDAVTMLPAPEPELATESAPEEAPVAVAPPEQDEGGATSALQPPRVPRVGRLGCDATGCCLAQ